MTKRKRTNYLQNTTHKTNDWTTRTSYKKRGELSSCFIGAVVWLLWKLCHSWLK